MPTKFILHGGVTSAIELENNQNYFKEVINLDKEEINLLFVYFARPQDEWQKCFEQDKRFITGITDKKIFFVLADDNIDRLINQIQKADIIYVRGGNDLLLQTSMKKLPDLAGLFANKIYAGSSAGANLIAKYYYSNSRNQVEKGLGLLPIKVICHYSEDKQERRQTLKEFKEDLDVHSIAESQYVIINH